MSGEIEARLAKLGLTLPPAPNPVANYVPYLVSGDHLFISGQISKAGDGTVVTGRLGGGLTIEAGAAAARLCALNILAQAKAALGSLERIAQVVRLTGFVAATPDFTDHPKVVNGASDLMVEVLGDKGRHTRAARRRREPAHGGGRRGGRHPAHRAGVSDARSRCVPAPDRAPRIARRGARYRREHRAGLRGRDRQGLRHRMRPPDRRPGGLPLVFHDFTLERLVHGSGPVAALAEGCARKLRFKDAAVTGILTFADLLDLVAGRVPLLVEVKSEWGPPDAGLPRARSPSWRAPTAVRWR